MTEEQMNDVRRDLPAITLRSAILDTVDAHKAGAVFDPQLIEQCRDQLSAIFEDLTKKEAA